MSDTINKLIDEVNDFRDERDWRQFHSIKDLALSLSIECSELLECFQWKNEVEIKNLLNDHKYKSKVADEIADISIYLLYLVSDLGLELNEVILEKLKQNKRKYPIDKSKGSNKKYNEL